MIRNKINDYFVYGKEKIYGFPINTSRESYQGL